MRRKSQEKNSPAFASRAADAVGNVSRASVRNRTRIERVNSCARVRSASSSASERARIAANRFPNTVKNTNEPSLAGRSDR